MTFDKTWQKVTGVIITLATLTGLMLAVESHWARASDFRQLNQRFEEKINADRLDRVQERVWKLEDRFGCDINKMPASTKEEYRKLIEEKKWYEEKAKTTINSPVK